MKYKVILADDEMLIVKSLEKIIDWEALQCEVVAIAQDGKEVLDLFNSYQPHIIVTDICMPEMSGIELLKALQSYSNRPEVLLVSGYNEFEYAREGLHYQAFDYILKPIDHEEFTNCIRRMTCQLKERAKSDYELKKHKIYDWLLLGNLDETYTDELSIYSTMIIKFRQSTDEDELALKKWISNNNSEFQQNFLYKLENEMYLIVTVNDKGDRKEIELEEKANRIVNIFKDKCTVAIGKSGKGINNLLSSYQQAKSFIEKSSFLKMKIISEEDIKYLYKAKSTPEDSIRRAEIFLKEHFSENIGVDMVAEQVGLSVSHLSVLFKQKTGETVLEYLTRLRVEHACLLLQTTNLKTYEIANMVGYTDQRYFSQVFKKYLSLTPSQYRKD